MKVSVTFFMYNCLKTQEASPVNPQPYILVSPHILVCFCVFELSALFIFVICGSLAADSWFIIGRNSIQTYPGIYYYYFINLLQVGKKCFHSRPTNLYMYLGMGTSGWCNL